MPLCHTLHKRIRHLRHTLTKQWFCVAFGKFGMYFEMTAGLPVLVITQFLMFNGAAKDCLTIAPWFCGPNYGAYDSIADFDPFIDETSGRKRERDTKENVITSCGKGYLHHLPETTKLVGTQEEQYLQAGQLYFKDIVHNYHKTFLDDFGFIVTLWFIGSGSSLVLSGFLILAAKMKVHGDKKALQFVFGATFISTAFLIVGVALFQDGRFCVFDFAEEGLEVRKIGIYVMIYRVIYEGTKLIFIWRLIRELQDQHDLLLKKRNQRFNSVFYHEKGVEAELHLDNNALERDPEDEDEAEQKEQHHKILDASASQQSISIRPSTSAIASTLTETTLGGSELQ